MFAYTKLFLKKKACHCQTIIEEVNDEVKSEKKTSVEHEKEKAVKSCNCG